MPAYAGMTVEGVKNFVIPAKAGIQRGVAPRGKVEARLPGHDVTRFQRSIYATP
jgi:hypothetical protein